MKWNPICQKCVRDCKQPPSVTMISCPAFEEADKNLDLFDLKGNIRKKHIAKKRRKRRSPAKDTPGDTTDKD